MCAKTRLTGVDPRYFLENTLNIFFCIELLLQNDEEPQSGNSFGAHYEWCGWRVRATALQTDALDATPVRRASNDTALVSILVLMN